MGRFAANAEREGDPQMSIAELIQEFEMEAATTRPVLERVPSDKRAWAPHAKSMSLGKLAMHIASVPGFISGWSVTDSYEFTGDPTPTPSSTADILAAHDRGIQQVKDNLAKVGDANLGRNW